MSDTKTPKIEKSDAEWRDQLTPEQYRVTRRHGTERAFTGPYWDSHESAPTAAYAAASRCSRRRRSSIPAQAGRATTNRSARMPSRRTRTGRCSCHPHRDPLRRLRFPSRSRLPGRSATDRAALLHERRRAGLRAGRRLTQFRSRRRPSPSPSRHEERGPHAEEIAVGPEGREEARHGHASRHHPHRRLCLAAGRQLAGRCSRTLRPSTRRSAPISRRRTPTRPRPMEDTAELRKRLFAEMKGRIKEDDSSVPTPDGPYAYGMAFVERRRAAALLPRPARRRRQAAAARRRPGGQRQGLFPAVWNATIPRTTSASSGATTTRAPSSIPSACATSAAARTSRISSRTPAAAARGRRTPRASSTRCSTTTTVRRRCYYHRLGTPQADDRLVYEETDAGFFMGVGRQPPRRLHLHRHPRPRDVGDPAAQRGRSARRAGAGRRARDRRRIRPRRRAATSSSC